MSLEPLFQELEARQAPNGEAGTIERRITSRSPCDLFVGVQKPANTRAFRARFSEDALPGTHALPEFRGMEVQRQAAQEDGRSYAVIRLRLVGSAFSDVFTTLVEDIEQHIAPLADEREAAIAFVDRLVKWQHFLEQLSGEGLGPEQQRGLYGELWLLFHYVLPHLPPAAAVRAWTGPERTAKDFQFPGGAIEVKTATAKQPQLLQISSEKQLDDEGLSALYLFVFSAESAQGSGQCLPDLVQQIRAALGSTHMAQQDFEDKLHEAGYWDAHADRYRSIGYIPRGADFFRVHGDFPRLIERTLPGGVGSVRYLVAASALGPYRAAPEDTIPFIKGMQSL